MLFTVLQNNSLEFRRHIIRQELDGYGFVKSAIVVGDDGEPMGCFALSEIEKAEPTGWVIMSRLPNGYLFRSTFPVPLIGLEGLKDLQTAAGGSLPAIAFDTGVTTFKLVRSDEALEEVLLRIIRLRARRYAAPSFGDLMAKFITEEPPAPLPLTINEVRFTGRVVDAMELAPGYRLRLRLAQTEALVRVDFQPLVGDVPLLQAGDAVYVSGELDADRVIAFEVQRLVSAS